MKKYIFILLLVLFGDVAIGQRHQTRLIIPDSITKKYPILKLKSDTNEVWVQNIWLKDTPEDSLVFCEPSTPNSYLLCLSYMPKRKKKEPSFTKFDTTAKAIKYNKFGIPIVYRYRSITDYIKIEKELLDRYFFHPESFPFHPEFSKSASTNGWAYFLNETDSAYVQNEGSCLVEFFLFESSKDLIQDFASLDINKRVFFPKDTVNQFTIEKYQPSGMYKNHIYLHKKTKSGLYYFWIIQEVVLDGCSETIDGISYDCEDWYLKGYFDIIFDPKIGIVGKTYSGYFYPDKDNTYAPVFMRK